MSLRILKKLGMNLLGGSRPAKAKSVDKPVEKPSRKKASRETASDDKSSHGKHPSRERRRRNRPSPPGPESQKRWTVDQFKVPPAEGKVRFHDIDLPLKLMRGIADQDFKYCTPVQEKVLPHARLGKDVAARAQTGTGKTAAFLLSTFARFMDVPVQTHARGTPRALIIAPTRELVIQIMEDARELAKYCPVRVVAVYGGMDYEKQQRELARGHVDIVAATPGRLLDFCRKKIVNLHRIEVLVIDEADRMLDMGFIPDVRRIVRMTPRPEKRQTMLFSATLTDDVMRLASQWMRDPVVVEIAPEQVAVDTVEQIIYSVTSAKKFTVLYNLLKSINERVLIFCNRRDGTRRLADELYRYGIDCELLSGAVEQKKRLRILEDFRSGRLRVVVATDVAGRGLHVDDISHVINYDFPYEAEDYVHRIGRTGRAGSEGKAVSFACEDESFIIPDIEEYIGESLKCKLPEEEFLAILPKPSRARPRRPKPVSSGPPGRGGRSSGRPSGGRRPPRSRSGPPRRSR
jgi:ATP-dependent RNA helicase RhlB